ncbi:MAG: hypothetical protein AAF772_18870, partial [Acidobacteriota bacterium]
MKTLASPDASAGERVIAAASLASEVASPVSVRDAKAASAGIQQARRLKHVPARFHHLADRLPSLRLVRKTSGRSSIFETAGDFSEAKKAFERLEPANVRVLSEKKVVGTLPSGESVIVRLDSSDGRPTLEIQSKG